MLHRHSPTRTLLALAGVSCALAGCVTDDKQSRRAEPEPIPRAFLDRPVYDPSTRPMAQAVPVQSAPFHPPPEVVSRQRLAASLQGEGLEPTLANGAGGELIPVKLATNNAAPADVLRILLTDYLEQDFVLDPDAVSGARSEITLDVDQQMTRKDLRDLLDGLAMVYGWIFEERGDVLYVRPAAKMGQNADTPILRARAAFPSETPVIRIRPLRYLDPAKAVELLSAGAAGKGLGLLTDKAGAVAAVGRTLLILDTERRADRVARILMALDTPAFDGVEIWTYRLGFRAPQEAATLLDTLGAAANLGDNAANPLATFIPLPGTDRLMVVSRDPSAQTVVADLIAQIDRAPENEVRRNYVYHLQHWDTTKLLNLTRGAFAGRILPDQQPSAANLPPADGIRITPDQSENLFLINATPGEFAELLATFRLVDRARQQVVISSIIAEVSLTNRLEFGVEYFLDAFDIDGLGILELTGTPGLLTGATGSAVFTAADGFAVVQALQSESDVNILSQPSLTARDGDTASFNVGGETPILQGSQDTETGGLRQDIQYQQTGITLEYTPQINEGGEVTLQIRQTVRDVVSQGDLGPEFTTRELNTNVTVPHGVTVILGGFIETTTDKSVSKIPILGDIPLLGYAFQTVKEMTDRRELILAVTPRIINEPRFMTLETAEFLAAAEGLRATLHRRAEDLGRGALNFEAPPEPSAPGDRERRRPNIPDALEELIPELREIEPDQAPLD